MPSPHRAASKYTMMIQTWWQRFLNFLLPERTLDADNLAALRLEDNAVNLDRYYKWGGAQCLLQLLVLGSIARTPVSTGNEEIWRRNALLINLLIGIVYISGSVVAQVTRRYRPTLRFDRVFLLAYVLVFTLFAIQAINAQLATNSVIPYLMIVASTPHLIRVSMGWMVGVVGPTAGLLMVGVYLVQTSPVIRHNHLLVVCIGTLAGFGFAAMHRMTLLENVRMRRMLQKFNTELESRVAAQTLDLRRFARRLDEVLETERRRLARELHDDLGQELTALRLELESIRPTLQQPRALNSLDRMAASIARSHLGVRNILESLRPRILDEEGLESAVSWLALQLPDRVGCAVHVDVVLYDEPSPEVGLVAFRIVQEALTNVARHAEAKEVQVVLHATTQSLRVEIADDGIHHREGGLAPGRGLAGMRERVLSIGGTLEVGPRAPQGTRVVARLPLQPLDAA